MDASAPLHAKIPTRSQPVTESKTLASPPGEISTLHLHHLLLPCHHGQMPPFVRGTLHLDKFLAVSPKQNPERDFLPCTPSFRQFASLTLIFFYHTTLYSEGGVIEGREGETNHPVRLVDTGLSTHTYLSPHLFVVLRFPSAQSSYSSILRFWHLPSQCRDCDHIYSSLLLPLTSQDQEVHLRSIGPFSFPFHFRPVHLCS